MPTYIYETVPKDPDDEPRRFEVTHGMTDDPLTIDPASGEPVRQVISGGLGIKRRGLKRSTTVMKSSPASTPCCHHGPTNQHHRH